MWRFSQWKRERIAMSFHVDDYSLDPKSGVGFRFCLVVAKPWRFNQIIAFIATFANQM